MAHRGGPIVRLALQLAPLLFQRRGELRDAAWVEIDFDSALWTFPAALMKRGKDCKENGDPHLVALSIQAVEILRNLDPLTRQGPSFFLVSGTITAQSLKTLHAQLYSPRATRPSGTLGTASGQRSGRC